MLFKDFSRLNRNRCESKHGFNHLLSAWSTSDWMVAIQGELGEAANIVKKLNRVRDGIPGNVETPEQLRAGLKEELADVFIYLDLTAQSLGFYLEDVVVEKFQKTSRKIGYDKKELLMNAVELLEFESEYRSSEQVLPTEQELAALREIWSVLTADEKMAISLRLDPAVGYMPITPSAPHK